jgi:hypothetical protein
MANEVPHFDAGAIDFVISMRELWGQNSKNVVESSGWCEAL